MKDNFNYSIEVLKKAAFVDELNNLLKIYTYCDDEEELEEREIVINYLEKRILQINEAFRLLAN
jgi:hypothetical protein